MAFIRCDVASNGPYRYQQLGEFFPRCDVSPPGGWVASDCHPDGSVYVKTSMGLQLELGPRHPDNPACPRFQTDGLFHLYMVAVADVNGVKTVYGRHLTFDALGNYLEERDNFDASLAGSQGILDVTPTGEILWWDYHNWREVDGLVLRSPRERGDFLVGVLQEHWLGISVYEKSTGHWYRAWPYDTQLLAGIADDGTVAAQGEGGGFIERRDWITRRFDPHEIVVDPVPPTITTPPQNVTVTSGQTATFSVAATGTAPLFYQWFANDSPITGAEESTYTTPPLTKTTTVSVTVENLVGAVTASAVATVTVPIDPPEPKMTRSTVLVDNQWHEVEEMDHPDAALKTFGPVLAVHRVSDGWMLKVRSDGNVLFETGTPGADERLIAVPGAYVALRDVNVVVEKAGPWPFEG